MTVLMSEGLAEKISLEELETPEGTERVGRFSGIAVITQHGPILACLDAVSVAPGGEVLSVAVGIHPHEAGLFCRGILVSGVMWTEAGEKEISWVLPERKEGYSYSVANRGGSRFPDVHVTVLA